MLFNSFVFIFILLPVSVVGYYLFNKIRNDLGMFFLLLVNLVFIGFTNYLYLVVLIPSSLFNYLIGYLLNIRFQTDVKKRKCLLTVGVSFNVVVLFIFKYYSFFAETFNVLFKKDLIAISIILPLGISFYTFHQISFIVDYYRDKTLSCSLLEYMNYITFYPQFVQGPIVLQSEFIPQLRDKNRKAWNEEYAVKGLYRFILGLAKKVLIADAFGKAIDQGYNNLYDVEALGAVILILGYSLQIYFDFSGYSDMAVGIGMLFNIDLPENFDSPYKARSIEDFWDRWHITLTRFMTRYVYIPLGGNRKGEVRTYANILFVFLLSGLWHGAEWSFIIWGLLHGMAMVMRRVKSNHNQPIPRRCKKNKCRNMHEKIRDIIKLILTYIFVSLTWVFFRAGNTKEAISVIAKLFRGGWNRVSQDIYEPFNKLIEVTWFIRLDIFHLMRLIEGIEVFVITILITVIVMMIPNSRELMDRLYRLSGADASYKENKSLGIIACMIMSVLLAWSVLSFTGEAQYIYWNF